MVLLFRRWTWVNGLFAPYGPTMRVRSIVMVEVFLIFFFFHFKGKYLKFELHRVWPCWPVFKSWPIKSKKKTESSWYGNKHLWPMHWPFYSGVPIKISVIFSHFTCQLAKWIISFFHECGLLFEWISLSNFFNYIYIYMHTHTYTHIYIFKYNFLSVFQCHNKSKPQMWSAHQNWEAKDKTTVSNTGVKMLWSTFTSYYIDIILYLCEMNFSLFVVSAFLTFALYVTLLYLVSDFSGVLEKSEPTWICLSLSVCFLSVTSVSVTVM